MTPALAISCGIVLQHNRRGVSEGVDQPEETTLKAAADGHVDLVPVDRGQLRPLVSRETVPPREHFRNSPCPAFHVPDGRRVNIRASGKIKRQDKPAGPASDGQFRQHDNPEYQQQHGNHCRATHQTVR